MKKKKNTKHDTPDAPTKSDLKKMQRVAEKLEKNWQKDLADLRKSLYEDDED